MAKRVTTDLDYEKNARDERCQPGLRGKLWQVADKLRNNIDAAECKQVVLGLVFLKCVSYAFLEHHQQLSYERPILGTNTSSIKLQARCMVLEHRDEYATSAKRETLAMIRNTLLLKLLPGQFRAKDADKLVAVD